MQIKTELGEMRDLLYSGHRKKVRGSLKIVEEIITTEKVVARKAIKERTGISNSELSRCLSRTVSVELQLGQLSFTTFILSTL